MFKKIKKISTNTNDVYFSSGKFIYQNSFNLHIINWIFTEAVFFISDENFIIEKFVNDRICLRKNTDLMFFDDAMNEISLSLLPNDIIRIISISKDKILSWIEIDDIWYVGVWSIKDEKYLWLLETEPILAAVYNGNAICNHIDGEKLFCISLDNGLFHWNINFNDLLNVSDVTLFGDTVIYNNQAFVFASNFRKWGIFAIDIQTGQVVNQSKEIGGWLELYNDNFYVAQDYLLKKLNPITFEVETFNLQSELEPFGIRVFGLSKRYLIKDNLFYFVSQTEGVNKVGVIDLETKKLLWQTTIQVEKAHFSILKLEVEENRLFVLTQGGLLYIFEREDTIL